MPIVVVLPTPFTPTTMMTYGFLPSGIWKPSVSEVLFSVSKEAISSRRMLFNSLVLTYLSRSTRASMRLMMLRVVSTPTSLVTRTSSSSSRTSSSTLLLPATARASLPKNDSLVFSRPRSRFSFCSCLLREKKLKRPMCGVTLIFLRANLLISHETHDFRTR